MLCGIEWWAFISKKNAYRICYQFNLEVSKGYRTKREFRIENDDIERTFRRKGKYEHLNIEVKKNAGKYILTVRGSVHKFYHGDNKSWFNGIEVVTAVQGLCDLFEVESKDAKVENLEVGINLVVLFMVYKYLERNLLYHKKKTKIEFNKKGVGYLFKYDDYWIKIYQKDFNLLRFEVKYKSQAKLDSFGIRRLSDLNKESINKLVLSLIEEWNEIVLRGGIDILNKKSWQQKITQIERDKISDYTSSAYQQSYQDNYDASDRKQKEALRKEAQRLKNFCVLLVNDRGDKEHEKIGILIKEGCRKFIAEWNEV